VEPDPKALDNYLRDRKQRIKQIITLFKKCGAKLEAIKGAVEEVNAIADSLRENGTSKDGTDLDAAYDEVMKDASYEDDGDLLNDDIADAIVYLEEDGPLNASDSADNLVALFEGLDLDLLHADGEIEEWEEKLAVLDGIIAKTPRNSFVLVRDEE